MYSGRQQRKEHLKPIDADKALILKYLRQTIGTDFATATTPSNDNLLQLDLADWGGQYFARRNAPWSQMEQTNQDYREFVTRNVNKLFPRHHWQ